MGSGQRFTGLITRFVITLLLFIAITAELLHVASLPLGYGFIPPGAPRGLVLFLSTLWWYIAAVLGGSLTKIAALLAIRTNSGGRGAAFTFFADTLSIVFFLVATIATASYVFELPVSTVFATSSIIAVVLGFALQSTLGDLFGGIALAIERPFQIGDWITIDEKFTGRVVEITWRTTRLSSKTEDTIVFPNAFIARSHLINHYLPTPLHRIAIMISVSNRESPVRVSEVLTAAVMSAEGIADIPPPSVDVRDLTDTALLYKVKFHVPAFEDRDDVMSDVYKQIWLHLSWAGLARPHPRQIVEHMPVAAETSEVERIAGLLGRVPVFAPLEDEERQQLAAALKPRHVSAHERLLSQFDEGRSLFIVREGLLDVSVRTEDGDKSVARLYPGDYVGENSLLTGAPRNATITAITPSSVYELDKDDVSALLELRPEIADEFGRVLATREHARLALPNGGAALPESVLEHFTSQIAAFFHHR